MFAQTALVHVPTHLPIASISIAGTLSPESLVSFVACLPVRDEETHIRSCLDALHCELEPSGGVILIANDCRDNTVHHALERMSRWKNPWLLAQCQWQPDCGSAPLARRLAMDLGASVCPSSILLSIDGDTIVSPGLRSAYAQDFAQGFDLVCGRIGFIRQEAAKLPEADASNESLIREYRETSRRIEALMLPDLDNPWPNHGNIGGANFAIRASAYARIGGLPTPPSAEDRALRRLCQAHRLRIRYSDGPRVETSCRLQGRAAGGLSDELRRNRSETDPIVDELLEPPKKLLLRLGFRKRFEMASHIQRLELLRELEVADIEETAALPNGLGWLAAEESSPLLRRTRLRLSDLAQHLNALRAALTAAEAIPYDTAALQRF